MHISETLNALGSGLWSTGVSAVNYGCSVGAGAIHSGYALFDKASVYLPSKGDLYALSQRVWSVAELVFQKVTNPQTETEKGYWYLGAIVVIGAVTILALNTLNEGMSPVGTGG